MLQIQIKNHQAMTSKKSKPDISIDVVKDVVKKLKNKGIDELTHHQLAIALTTIGFKEVCKQFGTEWTVKHQKQALNKLSNSQYDLSWLEKVNNPNYVPFLQLCSRGDSQKMKQFIETVGKKGKAELITITDNFKRTALHIAVNQNFDVLAEYLINEGFSLTARDRQLKTPLHYCKSELVCHLLLKKGANVTLKDNKNCTIAHYAASGRESRVLQLVLKKTNIVNEVDADLKTPLFYAVFNGGEEQLNIIRVLIQNGAKVNQQDSNGRTPLHYASELGRTRCIPYLLKKGASSDIQDKSGKTPLDLCSNDKVKKLFGVYTEEKGGLQEKQQKQKRLEFSKIAENTSKEKISKLAKTGKFQQKANPQIYTKQVNQVSTWVRQKFFVLMKKLQQSGIKSLWHIKRPYIYTGSWAEDVEGLEDLYQCFINLSGAEAAMRTFNILCPYEKALPTVIGKSEEAFQSFFGENWFSNDPVQKVRNMHSQAKIRSQLQLKVKEAQDLKTQLLGYRSEIENLEGMIMGLKQKLRHYQKIEDDLKKERAKNTQQYTQILKNMHEISNLKDQINRLNSGEEKTEILSNLVQELRSKNEDLIKEINSIKVNEAAARRKCGQLFLKSLSLAKSGESFSSSDDCNLFDDDAIINMYQLLRSNPPNLEKRYKLADKRGVGKLNIEQFTKMLQDLSMLPQDVMSMHRITGFSQGRKTLSLEEFKTILENRHKNRPMWQKQLIRKIKDIILSSNITLQKFFQIVDVDQSGTVEPTELRKGLQSCNIFMNQTDWSNLFNLLDADKSGTIELEQMKALFEQESSGKMKQMEELNNEQNKEQNIQKEQEPQQQQQKQQQKGEQENLQEKQNEQAEQAKQQNIEEEKQQPQKIQQPHPQNDILSEQFSQEYQQKGPQLPDGIVEVNGKLKVQVPILKDLLLDQNDSKKVYIRFLLSERQWIKMADTSLQKLKIIIQIDFIKVKVAPSDLKLYVSVYKTREFNEQNYLGELQADLKEITETNQQKIIINDFYPLKASEFQGKEVEGQMILQIKWIPSTD